jgi:pimeloyl-ACP methyl ester carboxylesterase
MIDLGATDRVLTTPNGASVRLLEVGEGPVCVFLPGLLGCIEHYEQALRRLSDRCRCIVVDFFLLELRREWANLEFVTETFRELMRSEALAPAVLCGNSFGGHVALLTALDHPELARGLVLAGSSGLAERTFEKDVEHRPSRRWLERKIGELFSDDDFDITEFVDHAHRELRDPRKALMLVKLARSTKRRHLGDALPRVTSPTLVLWGKDDEVTDADTAREFARLIPDSELCWIERCGHAPMIERPIEFADGIRAFLDRLDEQSEKEGAAA